MLNPLSWFKNEEKKEQQNYEEQNTGLFDRLAIGLKKTHDHLVVGIEEVVLGNKVIDEYLLGELETHLLSSDIGVKTTLSIIEKLTEELRRNELSDEGAVVEKLSNILLDLLKPVEQPLIIDPNHKPFVILVIGVNGSGKTTTIGKLARTLQNQGKSVLLAAGDTFRAAAIEQLQVWGERNNVPVVAQLPGSDSASVVFDAISSAKARGIDVVIADTAGRLHTQANLMEELKKIKRVIKKLDDSAPHETMLILDSCIGQNTLQQAQQFNYEIGVTGLTITKMDGTAKGGVIFSIADELKLPIRFIGVGESIEDFKKFDANNFVSALFSLM